MRFFQSQMLTSLQSANKNIKNGAFRYNKWLKRARRSKQHIDLPSTYYECFQLCIKLKEFYSEHPYPHHLVVDIAVKCYYFSLSYIFIHISYVCMFVHPSFINPSDIFMYLKVNYRPGDVVQRYSDYQYCPTPKKYCKQNFHQKTSGQYIFFSSCKIYIDWNAKFKCIVLVFFSFAVLGIWTQSLSHARQVLYHLSYTSTPFVVFFFLRQSLSFFAQAGLELVIFLPLLPQKLGL